MRNQGMFLFVSLPSIAHRLNFKNDNLKYGLSVNDFILMVNGFLMNGFKHF